MYDNIKFMLYHKETAEYFERFAVCEKEQINTQTGQINLYGSVEGLRLEIHPGVLCVHGSLSKVLYPNNIYPLDRHGTKEAIEKLSDSLHVDFNNADVLGLEYGTQYAMKHPVCEYLNLLGDITRFLKFHCFDSIYYRNKDKRRKKILVFYDKIADARAKGMQIPPGFENMNLLKYELRLQGKLQHQLKTDVKASTLYQETFYRNLMKLYQEYYFKISKMEKQKYNDLDGIKTVNDALNVLMGYLINQADKDIVNGFIQGLKDADVFKDRKYYTRLNKKINEIVEKGGFTMSNEYIKELDDAIKNIGAYV